MIPSKIKNMCITNTYKKFNALYKNIFNKDDFLSYLNDFFDKFINENKNKELNKKLFRNKKMYYKKIKIQKFIDFIYLNFDIDELNLKKKNDEARQLLDELNNKNEISLKDTCIRDLKNLIKVYTIVSSSKDESLIKKFKSLYHEKDRTSYIKEIINEIYTWANNTSTPLVKYRFIKTLTKNKMLNWFNKDLEISFLEIIIKNSNNMAPSLNMDISPIEYSMKIPIDPSNRRVTTGRNGPIFSYIQHINSNISVKTVINIPNMDDLDEDVHNQKLFNIFDLNILKILIQEGMKYNNFFEKRELVTDLGSIVNDLPYSKNERIYKEAYRSLIKMSSFMCIYEDKLLNESFTYDICKVEIKRKRNYEDIDTIVIEEYKKLNVNVVFSKKYIESMLLGAIFTDKLISCKSNIAKALINPIQCERYKKLNDKNLSSKLNFNLFFNAVLSMGTGNKSRKLKQIEDALMDIQKNAKIIKNFYRIQDDFYIEFYPLFPEERKNILNCLSYFNERNFEVSIPFKLKTI